MKTRKRGILKALKKASTASPEVAGDKIEKAIKTNVRRDAGRSNRSEVTAYRRMAYAASR